MEKNKDKLKPIDEKIEQLTKKISIFLKENQLDVIRPFHKFLLLVRSSYFNSNLFHIIINIHHILNGEI